MRILFVMAVSALATCVAQGTTPGGHAAGADGRLWNPDRAVRDDGDGPRRTNRQLHGRRWGAVRRGGIAGRGLVPRYLRRPSAPQRQARDIDRRLRDLRLRAPLIRVASLPRPYRASP